MQHIILRKRKSKKRFRNSSIYYRKRMGELELENYRRDSAILIQVLRDINERDRATDHNQKVGQELR